MYVHTDLHRSSASYIMYILSLPLDKSITFTWGDMGDEDEDEADHDTAKLVSPNVSLDQSYNVNNTTPGLTGYVNDFMTFSPLIIFISS